MNDRVTLFPMWKQAVQDAKEQFTYGDMITMDWLNQAFGIKRLERGTAEEFQKQQFDFLAAMDAFRDQLLEEHRMALSNVRGQGYRVLEPKEQTEFAMSEMRRRVRGEIRKAASRLHYVEHTLLSDDERKRNNDAMGKLAALQSFTRKTLRLPKAKA